MELDPIASQLRRRGENARFSKQFCFVALALRLILRIDSTHLAAPVGARFIVQER